MAKQVTYKLMWIKCTIGKEWEVEKGWEVVHVFMYTQEGQIMVLLRGDEK